MAIYESEVFTDTFSHIGLCAEDDKPLTQTLTIDDGTGKLYEYTLTKNLTWKEYVISPNFSTDPENPSILDNTQIIPNIIDSYDVVSDNGVDYDFSEDGVSLNHGEHETVSKILSIPRLQDVTQSVRYFTGWEEKTASITKTIEKTNLPPEMCSSLDKSCYTVPVSTFTSCSTDYEDVDPMTLITDWKIYIDRNSFAEEIDGERIVNYDESNANWELIHSLDSSFTLYWVYSEEGRYKINQVTTDTDGASSSLDRYEDIVFAMCDSSEPPPPAGACLSSGLIEVDPDRWQIIAIPMEYGFWDKTQSKIVNDGVTRSKFLNVVIDQIEDVYNVPASDLMIVANAYIGSINQFYNFVPGLVTESSVHNFPLVYLDDDFLTGDNIKKEITGFWIKAKEMPFKIKWEILSV